VAISVPQSAPPIEDVRDYSVDVAGYKIDTRSIYEEFQGRREFYRRDVREYMERTKGSISGLSDLESAISKVAPKNKVADRMSAAYDEIIDKMLRKELLVFSNSQIPGAVQAAQIEEQSKMYSRFFEECGKELGK